MTSAPSYQDKAKVCGSGRYRSCLYRGTVRHTRLRPQHHDFKYRVYYGLWDVDELEILDRGLRWFSLNRFNLFSLDVRDHGAGDGTPLRRWAEEVLDQAGIEIEGGRIELLAYPRVLGYVFNPISVWYCYGADDRLVAVIHEVRNTFGDKHSYVVSIEDGRLADRFVTHEFQKLLHVSPFNDLHSTYRFSLTRPGDRLRLSIHQRDQEGTFLRAGLSLTRLPLTDTNLVGLFFSHPLLTLKVVGGIHWQALRLWMKGARYHLHPAPPADTVTLVEDLRRVG